MIREAEYELGSDGAYHRSGEYRIPYEDDFSREYLRNFMEHYDVRRAFEIWDSLTFAQVKRGLAMGNRPHQHVSGVLGSLNVTKGRGAIKKEKVHDVDRWTVVNRGFIPISRYHRLPPEGAETARKFAATYAAARKVRS